MLLRSSSTPLLPQIPLSPFSDSPCSRDFDTISHSKLTNFPCSTSSRELNKKKGSIFRLKGFRRAWSDGNLDRLTHICGVQEASDINSTTPKKFPYRGHKTMLHTAPSFSVFNTVDGLEDEENDGKAEELMRTATIGESIDAIGNGDFCFGRKDMGLIEEEGEDEQEGSNEIASLSNYEEQMERPKSPPMYLAAGLGIDGHDGGGGDLTLPNFDGSDDIEEYYKSMVDQHPCHPLFLANYAQLLQSRGDHHGAEAYYHRAIMVDPEDGQLLMQYAKLDWQLHHDQDRALSNFQGAVQAAPQDSHVLAAYASFLWEIDDSVEEQMLLQADSQVREDYTVNDLNKLAIEMDFEPLQLPPALTIGLGDSASDIDQEGNFEEYYKRMVDENPFNSLVLRNYAQFLHESKGDLQGAEEYYSRAVLADPKDGEIKSKYAKLVWELYHDHEKALCYHEQAVQATPEDSNVLAAYASFLWETEENEEDRSKPSQFQLLIRDEGAVSTAAAANG